MVFPISKTDAAKALDVDRGTVADLIRRHDLPTVPVPYSKAHGIDRETFERLRQLTNHEGSSTIAAVLAN